MPFLNPRKRENVRRNYFMTKLQERMLPEVRIEPATVRIPGGRIISVNFNSMLKRVYTAGMTRNILIRTVRDMSVGSVQVV